MHFSSYSRQVPGIEEEEGDRYFIRGFRQGGFFYIWHFGRVARRSGFRTQSNVIVSFHSPSTQHLDAIECTMR
jgi:hypothetical protein